MDIQEIRQTPIWTLYEKGRNYHRLTGIYRDTDRNYNFFNGDQWAGAKLGDVEPLQILSLGQGPISESNLKKQIDSGKVTVSSSTKTGNPIVSYTGLKLK